MAMLKNIASNGAWSVCKPCAALWRLLVSNHGCVLCQQNGRAPSCAKCLSGTGVSKLLCELSSNGIGFV